MSVMSDVATELELYWTQARVGLYWSRELPSGGLASIASGSAGYTLVINRQSAGTFETLPEAIVAAGVVARAQLSLISETWQA